MLLKISIFVSIIKFSFVKSILAYPGYAIFTTRIIAIVITIVCCRKVAEKTEKRVMRSVVLREQSQRAAAKIDPRKKFEEFLRMFDEKEMAIEMDKLYIPARVSRRGLILKNIKNSSIVVKH